MCRALYTVGASLAEEDPRMRDRSAWTDLRVLINRHAPRCRFPRKGADE